MLNKIQIDSEDFLKKSDIYFEKENFRHNQDLFKTLSNFFDEFQESGESQFNQIFSLKNELKKSGDIITFNFNLDFLVSIVIKNL
jgi:hypothetical protein